MGGHYARAQNEPEEVARAIAEHYAPKGLDDRVPKAPISVTVALADKLDMLAGFFAAGIKPTGSRDPFALRRAALGVVRLVLDNGLELPLRPILQAAVRGYNDYVSDDRRSLAIPELIAFFAERLKVYMRDHGIAYSFVNAVFAVGEDDNLLSILVRAEALRGFLETDDGRNLLIAYRRASSIVKIEEKRDGRSYQDQPDPSALRDPAEIDLYRALEGALESIGDALDTGEGSDQNYEAAMAAIAALRAPVDAFFDRVKVNADEPQLRVNRLLLLGLIRSALGRVADFGLIEDAAG
jgi:glycyl-tRNA synthetase beta chain